MKRLFNRHLEKSEREIANLKHSTVDLTNAKCVENAKKVVEKYGRAARNKERRARNNQDVIVDENTDPNENERQVMMMLQMIPPPPPDLLASTCTLRTEDKVSSEISEGEIGETAVEEGAVINQARDLNQILQETEAMKNRFRTIIEQKGKDLVDAQNRFAEVEREANVNDCVSASLLNKRNKRKVPLASGETVSNKKKTKKVQQKKHTPDKQLEHEDDDDVSYHLDENGEKVWDVIEVLDIKTVGRRKQVLVLWGDRAKSKTWEPEAYMETICGEMIAACRERKRTIGNTKTTNKGKAKKA